MLNFNDVLKVVEEKVKDATAIGDPDKLLAWLKVLEIMKNCGMVQFNKGSSDILKQINENLN